MHPEYVAGAVRPRRYRLDEVRQRHPTLDVFPEPGHSVTILFSLHLQPQPDEAADSSNSGLHSFESRGGEPDLCSRLHATPVSYTHLTLPTILLV